MSGNSLRPQWIDVDSTAENGVITSIAARSFEVQLTRQPYGSDRVIITPTTIVTSNGASTSPASLHVGQGIYFTGSAVGPGPDTRNIYAVRVILDLEVAARFRRSAPLVPEDACGLSGLQYHAACRRTLSLWD